MERYYWLKLKRDFFKRHDIQIVEDMPNGKDYILFYVKLLCESVDHEGKLRFNEEIPYNENMLATITHTNIDTVRSAIKIFTQLQMMEILDDGTIYMQEVQKMLGSETIWAEKKRIYREKKDNVLTMSTQCLHNVRQEIDIEKELDKEIIINNNINNYGEVTKDEKGEKIFKRMLYEISENVTPLTYATFFENLKFGGIADDCIVLESVSLYREHIKENHKEILLNALKVASENTLKGVIWKI